LKEQVLNFQILPLECLPSAQLCSSISWEQNGYYAAQDFLCVSEENMRHIQESFERSPCKSTQPTEWAENLEYCIRLACVEVPFTVQLSPSFWITLYHCFKCPSQIRCWKGKALVQTPLPCCTLKPAAWCKMTALVSKWHCCAVNFKLFIVFHKFVISVTVCVVCQIVNLASYI